MSIALTLPPHNDFADWLSPILVKELRQGLKTRMFVSTFIVVQIIMIILMGLQMLALANGTERSTMNGYDSFFWMFIGLPLIFLMPARGMTAISEETKANTLDLVQLTRLSASRIVFGKWLALTAQTLLLVTAMLPYAVLRYFFGEVDIVSDMETIGLLVATSLMLTAAAIALSTAHMVVRVIAMVFAALVFFWGNALLMMRAFGGPMGGPSMTGLGVWMYPAIVVPIYIYLFLEIAATKIAPMSENHAARKRIVALLLGVVLVCLANLPEKELAQAWLIAFTPLWSWVLIEALCERTVEVPSLYTAWMKRGILGRLAGRVLYPGWASAVFFLILLHACMTAGTILLGQRGAAATDRGDSLAYVLGFASAVAPLAVLLLLLPRAKQRMWLYVLVQALLSLVFLVCMIAANVPGGERTSVYKWLAPFPTANAYAFANRASDAEFVSFYWAVASPVSCIIIAYVIIRALMEFRVISRLEQRSIGNA